MNIEERIALALGWECRIQGHARVKGWYRSGQYVGIELPCWASSPDDALSLLKDHCWELATCDDGYVCRIYTAPERGEGLLGEGTGVNVPRAICNAILATKTKPKNK